MTRRRLRTRLVVAMMAIAFGVLLLTAAVTAGLARRSEVTNARHDVQNRAEVVGPEFDTLIDQLPKAQAAAETVGGRRQLRRIRVLLNTTLRASNGAVVAIDANGQVQEGLGVLLGGTGDSPTLPDGVTADDLDTQTLLAGETQQGRDGDTVFVARPLTQVGGTTPVVVLAEEINNRPFGGNGLAVIGAAAISLGIAALVAHLPGAADDAAPRGDGDHRSLDRRAVTSPRGSTRPMCATTNWPASPTRSTRWPTTSTSRGATSARSC